MRRRLKNQNGVSLVELAVLIPLLLIFITGLIDYGITLRTVKRLSFAAKTGARYAAAQTAGGGISCGVSVDATPCAAILGGGANTVMYHGKWAACRSLQEAGLTGEDWEVTVDVTNSPNQGMIQPSIASPSGQVVRVTARRRPDATRFCIVCLDEVMGAEIQGPQNNMVQSTTTFALEGSCSF